MEGPGQRHHLGYLLAKVHKVVHARADAAMVAAGADLSEWILLRSAAVEPGLAQRALAQRMGIEGPTIVRHLDRLEADGLIERRRDPTDRRVLRIFLTDAGEARHRHLLTVADASDADLRDLLDPTLDHALREALGLLLDRLDPTPTNQENDVDHHPHRAQARRPTRRRQR